MKRIRYSKYTGSLAEELELESILDALADYLLDSGFRSPYSQFQELGDQQTLENLREALRQALENGDLFEDPTQERIDQMFGSGQIEDFIEQLIERMEKENYLSFDQSPQIHSTVGAGGKTGAAETQARFQVTDKALDFLGYKTLRDLLGSLGKASFGRHDTRELSTGVETSGGSRPYEFGDTMNLDVNATLNAAIAREGLSLPLNLEYSDLYVHQ
ncbi:MAG: hypothetical protein ABI076_00225, partial [Acidobacteriaceae bacterium]